MNPAILSELLAFLTPLIQAQFGDNVPTHIVSQLIAHASQIIGLVTDLSDGDVHLSVQTRNDLANLVLDLKTGGLK